MTIEKVNIRGVNISNVTMDEADAFIRERMENDETTSVYTPNSEIVQLCIEKPEFSDMINKAELIVPDGIGVVKAAKILGTPIKEKVAGFDLGLRVMKMAQEKRYPVFLFGGADETRFECGVSIADQCVKVMEEKLPGLVFAGTRHGYFKCGFFCGYTIYGFYVVSALQPPFHSYSRTYFPTGTFPDAQSPGDAGQIIASAVAAVDSQHHVADFSAHGGRA